MRGGGGGGGTIMGKTRKKALEFAGGPIEIFHLCSPNETKFGKFTVSKSHHIWFS